MISSLVCLLNFPDFGVENSFWWALCPFNILPSIQALLYFMASQDIPHSFSIFSCIRF